MAKQQIDWSPANWPKLLYRFLTSFRLATIVLVLLTFVTLFGTLGQVEYGLYAAKKKYFYSPFFTDTLFGKIPFIFPGGMPLMILLFINMTLGALVKVRKRWKGVGLLISHFGMLMLLAGAFVTHKFASDNYIALYPGMKADRSESYRDWQLEIMPLSEDGKAEKAWVYPHEALQTIRSDEKRVLPTDGSLPFEVVINGYSRNATPIPVSAPIAANTPGREVDGFKLSPQDPAKEAESNLPGAFLEIRPKNGDPIEAILWAGSYRFDPREKPMPFTFEVNGQLYGALLAKASQPLPFEVRLDEFIFERHPGVSMARNYESRVTRIEEGKPDTSLEIKMNEPMRYEGYTFFQESFGPAGSQPGDEMFSQFAVAKNPADQWPLYSLIITGIGLGIHFLIMLFSFSKRARKQHSTPAAS